MWALVAAGADVSLRDEQGSSALHYAAMFDDEVEGAAAAAAALIAAGADPQALNSRGKTPAALVLQHSDVASCAKLLEVLLGQPAGGGGRSGSGNMARSARSACSAAARGASQPELLLPAPSAPPLLESSTTHCPVCLEPGACLTGPCGHLVCEGCAQTTQVRTGLVSWQFS